MTTNPQHAPLPPGGPMSVEEYLHLDQQTPNARYEYLDGLARLMSGGSGEHDLIAFNTRVALDRHFSSGPCFVRGSDMQVLVAIKSTGQRHYVYPDVTVSCDVYDRRRGNTLIESPRLVVEVLSPSTELFDRDPKLALYKDCPSIQEVVLINQFTPLVEIHRRNPEDHTSWSYTQVSPGTPIALQSVDLCLSLAEIYRQIDFEEPLTDS